MSQALKIIKDLIPDILGEESLSPSAFIQKYWQLYKDNYADNANINGAIFEELITLTLIRQEIFPFYLQAEVTFIPNVRYDLIIYTNELGPLSLSAKTSLRERYKQADLESLVLKYVHRRAKAYLLTLDEAAATALMRNRDKNTLMGLDDIILASSPAYDLLIEEISGLEVISAPTLPAVVSNQVIAGNNFKDRYQK
jgi:hypothetical protein